ncbi:MAG: TonB-dependent receptor [Paludibacter sp.]
MKKVFLLLVVMLISVSGASAASGSIKGTIVDAGDQNPLDYVNIALIKKGTPKPLALAITDNKGGFVIPSVENGNYFLRITYVGYASILKPVEVSGKQLALGNIPMSEDIKELKGVEVMGQGSQMHFDIDKRVFSVDQNIAAAGGSASDVLKNIPSVTVDNQGNVSLRKDGNVEVWINGKASGLTADNRAQVLQQMPAESIESIEIMTNPSAKFSPEGSAGIINIVMKQNRKAGYYGSVSAGLSYPDGGKIGSNLGASINYNSGKVDAYLNLGYRAMDFQGGGQTDRKNWTNSNDTTYLHQNNKMNMGFSGLFLRAGIDYHLDTKNTLSLSGFGMAGTGYQDNYSDYLFKNQSSTILKNYSMTNLGNGTRPSLNLNLDYRHDFDKKGSFLTGTFSYSNHNRTGNTFYNQFDSISGNKSSINQIIDSKNTEYDFKVDYTKKFNENSKLEAGWESKINNRLSTSSGDSVKSDNTTNNIPGYFDSFNYNEQVHAAYVTYGSKIDKFTFQVGLRTEYMTKQSSDTTCTSFTLPVNVQNISRAPNLNDWHLFPSLYLSYSLPADAEIQLNYTNRVNRPRGQQINPFRNYSDPTNISYGNPDLSPQYSSSLELNYVKTWGAQTLSTSLYYHNTDSVIQNIRFMHSGIMESTYANVTKSQNAGLELISKNRLFKILSLTSTLNLYYSKLDSSTYINQYKAAIPISGQRNFSWSANIMANFMLSKTFSGQITAEYESAQLIAQGIENAKYSIDLGVRQTFLDRKLSVSLNVRDLLNSDRDRQTTSGTGFSQYSNSYFHGRMAMLTVTYNFGNVKPKPQDMKKMQGTGGGGDMMGGDD